VKHGGRRHGLNAKGAATIIQITLDDQTKDVLDAASALAQVSRAEIVRRALAVYWNTVRK